MRKSTHEPVGASPGKFGRAPYQAMIEGLYVAPLNQRMQTGMIPHSRREGVGKMG